jgi:hypothetical protein
MAKDLIENNSTKARSGDFRRSVFLRAQND